MPALRSAGAHDAYCILNTAGAPKVAVRTPPTDNRSVQMLWLSAESYQSIQCIDALVLTASVQLATVACCIRTAVSFGFELLSKCISSWVGSNVSLCSLLAQQMRSCSPSLSGPTQTACCCLWLLRWLLQPLLQNCPARSDAWVT